MNGCFSLRSWPASNNGSTPSQSNGNEGAAAGRCGLFKCIDAFTETRWITMQTTPRHYPF